MNLIEVQIDRLVGPTHHFGGLGSGNLASAKHAGNVSNPKAAALQGLEKMMLVANLGVPQFFLPPQPRPDFNLLSQLGFPNPKTAFDQAPRVFSAAMSSSAMWTANAATVTPAIDSTAKFATATIANLSASLHRSIEPIHTEIDLRTVLPPSIQIHSCIVGGAAMRDEGAANHMRLSQGDGPGMNLLVYGDGDPQPIKHWPRQTLTACQAVARIHQLVPENTFFLKQDPATIDAGAFHNDVVAMSHGEILIHHELAFEDERAIEDIEKRFQRLTDSRLRHIEVKQSELPLDQAVQTYLFNSQIVSGDSNDSNPIIICPINVQNNPAADGLVQSWIKQGIFSDVHYVDLNQSMAGGGGPACLRLRVPMSPDEVNHMPSKSRLTENKYHQLRQIIEEGYPESISLEDLTDSDILMSLDSVQATLTQPL